MFLITNQYYNIIRRKYFYFIILLFPSQFIFSQDIEQHALFKDRLLVEFGLFIPNNDIQMGANGSSTNDEIEFSETFNFNKNQVTPFINLEWKLSQKWKIGLLYYSLNNGNQVTLDEDIEFEDLTFMKGSSVRGGIDYKLYRFFLGRRILTKEKHSLELGLGIHTMNIGAFVEGDIITDGGDLEFENRKVEALIPLPNLGLWYRWSLNQKWMLDAKLDWFGLWTEVYSGGLWNFKTKVRYQVNEFMGIGLDYQLFFFNAEIKEETWNGRFNMDIAGPNVGIYFNF